MSQATSPAPNPEAWHRGPPQSGSAALPNLFTAIEAVANRQPDAAAFVRGDDVVTYAELLQRSLSLARHVQERTAPSSAIGVVLRREADIAVALLGCLAAGRTSLLLNAAHPAERVTAILADAGPAMVLSDLPAEDHRSIAEPAHMGPDWPMAVFYTSGSTGQPKGFVRTERQFSNRGLRQAQEFAVTPADCVLSLTSLATGTSATWFITAMLAGASFCVANPSEFGLRALSAMFHRHPPSILVTTPTLMRLMMELPNAATILARTRATYSVSEPVTRQEVEYWRRRLPAGCVSMISYGMTEANAIAGWFLPADVSRHDDRLPIGYPRGDYQYALVDGRGDAVPVGEPGSLWLRGDMLSPGEWRDGRIVRGHAYPDPHDPSQLILHTNDLVRLRPDGLLVFAGRSDEMVKIRGNRVEPAEVEAAIRRMPDIADVAVLARQHGDAASLHAFTVVRPGSGLDGDAIRRALRGVLPGHMIPSDIILLAGLPRLPNGKIDRIALIT